MIRDVEGIDSALARIQVIAARGRTEGRGSGPSLDEQTEAISIGIALFGGFLANIARLAEAAEAIGRRA